MQRIFKKRKHTIVLSYSNTDGEGVVSFYGSDKNNPQEITIKSEYFQKASEGRKFFGKFGQILLSNDYKLKVNKRISSNIPRGFNTDGVYIGY